MQAIKKEEAINEFTGLERLCQISIDNEKNRK